MDLIKLAQHWSERLGEVTEILAGRQEFQLQERFTFLLYKTSGLGVEGLFFWVKWSGLKSEY